MQTGTAKVFDFPARSNIHGARPGQRAAPPAEVAESEAVLVGSLFAYPDSAGRYLDEFTPADLPSEEGRALWELCRELRPPGGQEGLTKVEAAITTRRQWTPELRRFISRAWQLGHSNGANVEHHAARLRGGGEEWPDPRPIPNGLPPVEPFNSLLLPDSLRPWVSDIAERMQCPPEFAAVAVMVALASVVGRRVGIRPKRQDDWTVVANLWGAVIGRPGLMKTPPVQEVLTPLRRLEVQAKEFYEEAIREFNSEQEIRAIQKDVRKAKAKTDLRKGADLAAVRRGWDDDEEPQPPVRARYVVNDTTVEKLGEILEANANGVLIFRDELIGLLRSLDKEGHESARAFYLESWAGNGRFTYDRIGRGTLDIEAATVSVLGCIQPGPLRDYLKSGGSGGDDGLIQRFQLAVWPEVSAEWRNVDRWPDKEARTAAYEVFTRLNQLTGEQVGAERDTFDDRAVPFLRFDDAAQEVFDEWRGTLEQRVRSGDEHPAIESHLSKYRSLVPSLALLIHLAEDRSGSIGEASLFTAIAWAEFLESHARRIYSPVVGMDDVPARALLKHIRDGDMQDGFTLRDVYRAQWSGLGSSEDARRAVELLSELGWIRSADMETAGRSKTVYHITPRLENGR